MYRMGHSPLTMLGRNITCRPSQCHLPEADNSIKTQKCRNPNSSTPPPPHLSQSLMTIPTQHLVRNVSIAQKRMSRQWHSLWCGQRMKVQTKTLHNSHRVLFACARDINICDMFFFLKKFSAFKGRCQMFQVFFQFHVWLFSSHKLHEFCWFVGETSNVSLA